jgi:hypothetical protein
MEAEGVLIIYSQKLLSFARETRYEHVRDPSLCNIDNWIVTSRQAYRRASMIRIGIRGGARVGRWGSEEMNIGTLIIGSLMLVALAARKKKPVFGQMTLTSSKALEYLKTSEEAFVRQVQKIIWISKQEADKDGWAMPDWVMDSEKYLWTAILIDVSQAELPLLVYQKSAIEAIEAHLMKMESEGAVIDQVNPRRMDVDMGDDSIRISLWRNPKGNRFSRYHVDFGNE